MGENAYYFFFHHTNADTFTGLDHINTIRYFIAINMDGIKTSIAAFAVMAYVVADMEQRLPNGTDFPIKSINHCDL